MKRTALAVTLMLGLLLSTLAATLFVNVVTANPFMPSGSWSDEPIPPSINVQSPSETQNYYDGSDVWLNFTVTVPWTDWYSTKSGYLYPDHYATTLGNLTQVRFSIDGKPENDASKISESALKVSKVYVPRWGVLHFSVNLGQLSVGRHTIIINAEGSAYYGNLTHGAFSDTFPIDTDESDKTKLVHSSLQSNFVVGPNSTQKPFPTTLVIAPIAAVTVIGVGLLVYLKKRKH
ncbi:hypothetical protein JXA31_07265 [Candidatus Bathyarchaeota archaeon]|nr:hypothetical protein [Candidatus Bathyarchaeota archaeon]